MTATTVKSHASSEAALDAFVDQLDARIADLVREIARSDFWLTLTSPNAEPEFVRTIMREIYLEIFSYQPHTIEAAFTIIGRMPKTEEKLMKSMVLQQVEESTHGEMALRDYVRLGGDEAYARSRRISPASFAVASVWRMLGHHEDPLVYLGALYPFEGLTPIVCEMARQSLRQRAFPGDALEFIDFHATEDIKHTHLVRHLIKQVVAKYPQARAAIVYGMECFLQVYPLPVWNEALRRAQPRYFEG